MMSPKIAKILEILPDSIENYISKKFVDRTMKKYANLTIEGKENLNDIQKPTLFVCNHLSNADVMIVNAAIKEINPTFVAGAKLKSDPVTKLGTKIYKNTSIKPNSPDKEGLKRIIDLIKNGESIMIFPEGTRSREGKMIEGKRGILLIAKLAKVPIVPLALWGTEKMLPINEEGVMNQERFVKSDVHIRIGKQIKMPTKMREEDKKDYDDRAMNYIMGSIAELLPDEYKGFYGEEPKK
ncbi:1-acyl-sn-glycerol-3-phosphate acyltransferase [Clostridium collagenovorans DSM 3089]|uniref:1-acyl-sn-glycerol-3-phosphate acyltransferase n=1 Tax=Clostridium collagenovorans DSM 3089 TaxID=1121306 RepID=A0A1M5VZY6_9CLOT|nr:lysophospholipid acyltransferase family protein [Clostridium collagenovorans]SHH80777.1 1-acyl-sn-glycerol-3-phosphate acyltransferase [Clostridium collagenovorans DSM 3089]